MYGQVIFCPQNVCISNKHPWKKISLELFRMDSLTDEFATAVPAAENNAGWEVGGE